jgi:probable HAF family extracellular repeat protein
MNDLLAVRFTLALAFFVPAALSGGDQEYVLTDLAVASGRSGFYRATAINDRGEVAGVIIKPGPVYVCVVFDGKNLVELSTGCDTGTQAINAAGEVALSPNAHAFVWAKDVITDIGIGLPWSYVAGINNRRQVVGAFGVSFGTPPIGGYRAFLWQDNVMTDLGTLAGKRPDAFSYARAINDRGQIVGDSYLFPPRQQPDGSWLIQGGAHAFLWEHGVMRDLGTLSGEASAYSVGWGINSRGQVVGWSHANPNPAQQGSLHAFLWEDGAMIDLGAPGLSTGQAINDSAQIVGNFYRNDYDHRSHPFVWDRGIVTELQGLGGASAFAFSINKRGQVVGYAFVPDGTSHAVVWEKRKN